MIRYIGTKIVLAEPMDEAAAQFAGLLRADTVVTIGRDGTSPRGYKVVYEDGYTSWSPQETFERAYRPITDAELRLLGAASEKFATGRDARA